MYYVLAGLKVVRAHTHDSLWVGGCLLVIFGVIAINWWCAVNCNECDEIDRGTR